MNLEYIIDEYGVTHGGKWFYSHGRPGTSWYNDVENAKGWTLDFNLRVVDIEHGSLSTDFDKTDGVGVLVNDGTYYEVVYFFTQEIVFKNAEVSVTFDTTAETNYRIVTKGNSLKIFAKKVSEALFTEIQSIVLTAKASRSSNSYKPDIAKDSDGKLHAVWQNDSTGSLRILYSKQLAGDEIAWSVPEIIVDDGFNASNPKIAIDDSDFIYVVYESERHTKSLIGVTYKNDVGWNNPTYLGIAESRSSNHAICMDYRGNLHVVWQDDRFQYSDIYYARRYGSTGTWDTTISSDGEYRIRKSDYGDLNPAIDCFNDDIYITFTSIESENDKKSKIRITHFDQITNNFSGIYDLVRDEDTHEYPDHSNVLIHSNGKIFVAWDDSLFENGDIYTAILLSVSSFDQEPMRITYSEANYEYPKLFLHTDSSDIYIVWRGADLEPNPYSLEFNDPYLSTSISYMYVSRWNYDSSLWETSSLNGSDTRLITDDDRQFTTFTALKRFSGVMSILYSAFRRDELIDEYGKFKETSYYFSKIYQGDYDLSLSGGDFNLQSVSDTYSGDISLSDNLPHKELRFGNFSNSLSAYLIFKNVKYYLNDAVEPNEIVALPPDIFDFDELRVFDIVGSNYGDAWMASSQGLLFYFNDTGLVSNVNITLSESDSIDDYVVRNIAFDRNNVIFVGLYNKGAGPDKIIYSTDFDEFKELTTVVESITSLAFDGNRQLYVGTLSGVKVFNVIASDVITTSMDLTATEVTISALESLNDLRINAVRVDSSDVVWIGTSHGLYRLQKGNVMSFNIANGLPADYISDIAIRNKGVRYLATRGGVVRMIGTSFEVISSQSGLLTSNNIKSIAWRDPDILWASSRSKLHQIKIDDFFGEHKEITLSAGDYTNTDHTFDDFNTFFLDVEGTEFDGAAIPDNYVIEVYVNGNRVQYGYDISKVKNKLAIRFLTELKGTDRVDVIVRKDILLYSTLSQTLSDKTLNGAKTLKIENLEFIDNKLFALTGGDINDVRIVEAGVILPHDQIILDTTPPIGKIDSVNAVGGGIYKVDVGQRIESTDEYGVNTYIPFDRVSGIDKMVLSNYSNFTTDGTTAKTPVDFVASTNHDIGTTVAASSTLATFPGQTGSVLSVQKDASSVDKIWVGLSSPAYISTYNVNDATLTTVQKLSESETSYIDFISILNGKIIVGVGFDTGLSKIYISDVDQSSFTLAGSVTGNRVYGVTKIDNILYIGSTNSDGGRIYSFDGNDFSLLFENIGEEITSLSSDGADVFASTGDDGRLFKCNVLDSTAIVVHADSDTKLSSVYVDSESQTIFSGSRTTGRIVRSSLRDFSFITSFGTAPTNIARLKSQYNSVEDTNVLYAVIGKIVYYFTPQGAWKWQYKESDDVVDIGVTSDGNLYVLTADKLATLSSSELKRTIYLKLIDKAGNETSLTLDSGAKDPNYFYDITLSDFTDLINENQLIEIDDTGATIFALTGEQPFYSGKRHDTEKGEYESEIFNGTNEIIKWDELSYKATVPSGTSVEIYARSSASRNDILLEKYVKLTFNSNGISDIGNLDGQFLQFKIVLISESVDLTPSVQQVIVKSITGLSVHFFTTNFALTSKIKSGILTSQTLKPTASEIVFAINTTDSIDFADYQIIDQNRLENFTAVDENLRVGIKLLTPSRGNVIPSENVEYGPYSTDAFENAIDFSFENTGSSATFHFRVTLYEDRAFTKEVVRSFSGDDIDGFSVDNIAYPEDGKVIATGESENIIYTVPFSANVFCNEFYYVKIESYDGTDFVTISDNMTFILSCNPSFIDSIDFDFKNTSGGLNSYDFRVRLFEDPERTLLAKSFYSGNDLDGWFSNGIAFPEGGEPIENDATETILFRPSSEGLIANRLYYLTIDSFDGSVFELASNSFTFQLQDINSGIYCGPYDDVPVVNNFGFMFELENGDKLTLNK